MNRFEQEALFDRLAATGRLDLELMPPLAFHTAAEHRTDHGGKAGMSWVIEGNAAGFAEYGTGCLEPSACFGVIDDACRELDRRGELLDARRDAGLVRHCHGDLHLRNIVLLDGRPTLLDGVKFNDEISCTDVLYDLALLLMDLWRRRLPRHANAVWNRYVVETGDLDGLSLLPLFLSCRAAVRAKTSATAARFQRDARRKGDLDHATAEALTKPDASPVTLVDFAIQAVITAQLARDFPHDSVVAEEDASVLRAESRETVSDQVTKIVRLLIPDVHPKQVLDWPRPPPVYADSRHKGASLEY